jgi:hypothetical protein
MRKGHHRFQHKAQPEQVRADVMRRRLWPGLVGLPRLYSVRHEPRSLWLHDVLTLWKAAA